MHTKCGQNLARTFKDIKYTSLYMFFPTCASVRGANSLTFTNINALFIRVIPNKFYKKKVGQKFFSRCQKYKVSFYPKTRNLFSTDPLDCTNLIMHVLNLDAITFQRQDTFSAAFRFKRNLVLFSTVVNFQRYTVIKNSITFDLLTLLLVYILPSRDPRI